MKLILNRLFAIVFVIVSIIVMIVSTLSGYFVLHWIVFGANFYDDLITIGYKILKKFPVK